MGTLDIDPANERRLVMRRDLVASLGLKARGG
jgi:hypothetical protein